MSSAGRLNLVRAAHTIIYIVMVTAIFAILYAGVTGAKGPWLGVALALLIAEIVVFVGCGMKCPLTAVAVRNGADVARPADTFLPERFTRHTLHIFGPLIVLGLGLLAWRCWAA